MKGEEIMVKDEAFKTLYEKANEHLIENDKKRDQIFMIYSAISTVYFSKIQEYKEQIFYMNMLSLIFIVLGILAAFLAIEYRKWHIKYALSCTVIQKMMFSNESEINQKKITDILREVVFPTTLNKFLFTVETLIFNIYLLVNFGSVMIIAANNNLSIPLSIIIGIFIVVYFNFIYFNQIKQLCDKDNIRSSSIWILNIYEGDYEKKERKILTKEKSLVQDSEAKTI